MTESTLSSQLTDLEKAVAHYMGLGLDSTKWTTNDKAKIAMILKRGQRQFYFPPKIYDDQPPHEWSFLKPTTTLDTVGSYITGTVSVGQYATGTVKVSSGTCTLTGGIWPTWASANDTLTIGTTEYAITTRDSTTELTVTGDNVSTATAYTLVSGATTETKLVLGDGGTWPSWAYTHGTLVIDNTEYPISARDDDYELTLTTAWDSDDQIEGEDYVLRHNGNYDLPDDFGGIEGDLTHESTENKPDIQIIGEGRLRSLRRGLTTRTYPAYAAIRPKSSDGTGGQRFEIMFQPIPNDAYTLYYKKIILPTALVTGSVIYPYGGAAHADTVEASCLAIAELQEDERKGPQWDHFISRLTASVEFDKTAYQAEHFGYNADRSDDIDSDGRTGRHPGTFLATYNGEI